VRGLISAASATCLLTFAGVVQAHGLTGLDAEAATEVRTCLPLPGSAERLACYAKICTPDKKCGASLITGATEGDAAAGMRVVNDLLSSGAYFAEAEPHQLAHLVGRQLAKHEGLSGTAFTQCPQDYSYGCQHGFFEAAFIEHGSALKAAESICGDVVTVDKNNCYHGVGHGIMMAAAYDIDRGLEQCVSLREDHASYWCRQGMFMEYSNALQAGDLPGKAVDPAHPFAPCDGVATEHREACFSSHAGIFLTSAGNSLDAAVALCEQAGDAVWTAACMLNLGQHVALPDWQRAFCSVDDDIECYSDRSLMAASLCARFPEVSRLDCDTGAVRTMMAYAYPEPAVLFCGILPRERATQCFAEMSWYTRMHGTQDATAAAMCAQGVPVLDRVCRPGRFAAVRALFSGGLFGWLFGS
jgi:hypothetical protein